MPDIGKLRHRVWLQTKTETQDAEGGVVPTWTSQSEMWASIEPMSGRELEIASQMQSEATVKITIRFQRAFGFTNLAVLRFISDDNGTIFEIDSTQEPEFRHAWIIAYCKVITNRNTNTVLVDPNTNEPLLIPYL